MAASSDRMSPKRFVVTRTSNRRGSVIRRMAATSTSISSASSPANSAATANAASRKRPHVARRTFALWTMVTRPRRSVANSQANRVMRSDAARVMTRSVTASSPSDRSRPEYRPSEFSRTMSMSIPSCEEGTGCERTGRRLAYSPRRRRRPTMGLA